MGLRKYAYYVFFGGIALWIILLGPVAFLFGIHGSNAGYNAYCMNNLKVIGQALNAYFNDSGQYPPDLHTLYRWDQANRTPMINYPSTFCCISHGTVEDNKKTIDEWAAYKYNYKKQTIICFDRYIHDKSGDTVSWLYLDTDNIVHRLSGSEISEFLNKNPDIRIEKSIRSYILTYMDILFWLLPIIIIVFGAIIWARGRRCHEVEVTDGK